MEREKIMMIIIIITSYIDDTQLSFILLAYLLLSIFRMQ